VQWEAIEETIELASFQFWFRLFKDNCFFFPPYGAWVRMRAETLRTGVGEIVLG
jgi:hypothetical protein